MDIKDGLVLATLMTEATGCSMEAALNNLTQLIPAPAPVVTPAPAPEPALRPYSDERFVAFLDRATVGMDYTAAEICDRAGMEFPQNSKRPAYTMRRRGWSIVGIGHGGRHLYRKQPRTAEAAE